MLRENKIGVNIPEVLLPAANVCLEKWSVVACDQYTSQPEYWARVDEIVGNTPSTLRITFPEIFLEEPDMEERIKNINDTMEKYLNESILVSGKPGFIYVDRKTSHSNSRKGLIIAVDLEQYDYNKGSQSLIRATEGTVIERLPPRIRVRENASIELPHIMLLIDDPAKSVIEPLSDMTDRLEKVYDFDLMQNGGHIRGYKIEDSACISDIMGALEKLAQPQVFRSKYGVGDDKGILLFAVGDGNHSLASAKAFWERIKKGLSPESVDNHPARYALVEVVNVHDAGLTFEPIHRVVFNVDAGTLLGNMVKYLNSVGSEASILVFEDKEALDEYLNSQQKKNNSHIIPFTSKDYSGIITVKNPQFNLEVGTLQCFLDEFLKSHGSRIDYIHGDDVVKALGAEPGNIGFFLPAMDKCDLFKTVVLDGALPRKTFSMGEAEEKRFYLECRKIR